MTTHSNEPSDLARAVAGTFLEDAPAPAESVYRWLQEECRSGSFSRAVAAFSEKQEERLQPRLVRVEAITPESITCVVPGRYSDHESTSSYVVEVRCAIDPSTGVVRRL